MGDNIIGRFFADRIDGIRMEFYVYANGIIVCSMYPDILMKRIYLKPRIEYYGIDNKYHVLDNKDGFDLSHKTTVFKRVKDKSKILEKQKKGIYN